MNVNTPVKRRGHVVVDADQNVLFAGNGAGPLEDVVQMLNYQDLFVEALCFWDVLFKSKEMKDTLAELVGRDVANAVFAKTMLALHPVLWELDTHGIIERKVNANIAARARKAFPAIIALLSPDFYPALKAQIGPEGIEALDALIGVSEEAGG